MLGLLWAISSATAQDIDCSTVRLNLPESLSYKIPGTFPNPSKDEYKLLAIEKIDFKQCGIDIVSDGKGNTVVNAGSRENLIKLLNKEDSDSKNFAMSMVGFSGYKYPTIREGFYSYTVWFVYSFDSGEVRNLETDETKLSATLLKDATIGYKVNDGPLTPFFYEGKIIPATIPINSKTIDVFAIRKSYSNGVDRIRIDLEKGSYQIWKKHPFPSN